MKSVVFSLCLVTALVCPAAWNANTIVDFDVTVTAVHVLPSDNPMPGLHFEAKVNNRKTDVYIAPMDFVTEFQIHIAAGDDVRIVGSLTRAGDTDIVLARQITVGRNVFYLRNDEGEPLWTTTPII